MLARMQGRGRGCNKLPPVSDDDASPYVIARGAFAAYRPDTGRWRFTDTPAVGFETGAVTDPVRGRILLVSHSKELGSVDPLDGRYIAQVAIDEAELRSGKGVSLVYFPPNDRFYAIALTSRAPGVWEVHFDRENPAACSIRRLADLDLPRAPVTEAWAYRWGG